MPELPEVETVRLQLNKALKGLIISGVEVLKEKQFIGDQKLIIGEKITSVGRRAKIILIELENGDILAVHLKMTGQLIYRESTKLQVPSTKQDKKTGRYDVDNLPNKYTRIILSFNDDSKLYFNDLRTFGWMRIVNSEKFLPSLGSFGGAGKDQKSEIEKLIGHLGPEAIDEKTFTLEYFQNILSKSKKPIKLVIMDQEKVAGVGNIYANEALFMAGIDPRRKADSLKTSEIKKLYQAIIDVLLEAIKFNGTSDRDEAFRQIDGQKGSYQQHLRVYARAKQECPVCGGEIKKIKIGGRGTFYCEKCQK